MNSPTKIGGMLFLLMFGSFKHPMIFFSIFKTIFRIKEVSTKVRTYYYLIMRWIGSANKNWNFLIFLKPEWAEKWDLSNFLGTLSYPSLICTSESELSKHLI